MAAPGRSREASIPLQGTANRVYDLLRRHSPQTAEALQHRRATLASLMLRSSGAEDRLDGVAREVAVEEVLGVLGKIAMLPSR
jgi:hypothetical protein